MFWKFTFCLFALSGVSLHCKDVIALDVSPVDEMLVIPPKVHPENKPHPVFVKDESTGTLHTEIPPTVIVHRYYYTGDRCFQGPVLPGGSSVIVASHPKTGEQISVHAHLLPGAPKVRYTKDGIYYDYGKKRIFVKLSGKPKVKVSKQGRLIWLTKPIGDTFSATATLVQRSGATEAIVCTYKEVSGTTFAVADGVRTVGSTVIKPVTYLWESTPLDGLLSPNSESQNYLEDASDITNGFQNTIRTIR